MICDSKEYDKQGNIKGDCQQEGNLYTAAWRANPICLCPKHYQENKNGILKQGASK